MEVRNMNEQEYADLINELIACKGIGHLITVIQNEKDRLDEDFFLLLDNEIRECKEKGEHKREGRLSYLHKVMDNLHMGPDFKQDDNLTVHKEQEGLIGKIKKLFFSKM
jgi:hypothetical protein